MKQPKLGLYRVKNPFSSTHLERLYREGEILLLTRCVHCPAIITRRELFEVEFLSQHGIVDGRPIGVDAFWWFLEVVEA